MMMGKRCGVLVVMLGLMATACQTTDTAETAAGDAAPNEESTNGSASANDSGEDTPTSSSSSTVTSPTSTTSTTTSSTTAMPPQAAPAAQVVLLDPGAEPRSELRLQIPDGTTEILTMGQEQTIVQEIGGQPFQEVETKTIIRSEVTSSIVDGGFRQTNVVLSAEAAPDADQATAAQVTAALQAMVGVSTSGMIDDRGNLLDIQLDGTESLDAATRQLMQSGSELSTPLPAEPVGIGASWQVTQEIDFSGLGTEQTITYTLTDIDGSVITLDTSTVQDVEAGDAIEQGGVTIEVVSWASSGEGNVQIDLTGIVPRASSSASSTQELATAGSDETLLQTIETRMEIQPE